MFKLAATSPTPHWTEPSRFQVDREGATVISAMVSSKVVNNVQLQGERICYKKCKKINSELLFKYVNKINKKS